jgi:hypothetical protein
MHRRPPQLDPNYDDDAEPLNDDSDAIHAESLSSSDRNPSLLNP